MGVQSLFESPSLFAIIEYSSGSYKKFQKLHWYNLYSVDPYIVIFGDSGLAKSKALIALSILVILLAEKL